MNLFTSNPLIRAARLAVSALAIGAPVAGSGNALQAGDSTFDGIGMPKPQDPPKRDNIPPISWTQQYATKEVCKRFVTEGKHRDDLLKKFDDSLKSHENGDAQKFISELKDTRKLLQGIVQNKQVTTGKGDQEKIERQIEQLGGSIKRLEVVFPPPPKS